MQGWVVGTWRAVLRQLHHVVPDRPIPLRINIRGKRKRNQSLTNQSNNQSNLITIFHTRESTLTSSSLVTPPSRWPTVPRAMFPSVQL